MAIRRVQLIDVSGNMAAGSAGQSILSIKPGGGLRVLSVECVGVAGAAQKAADGFGDVLLQINGKTQRTHTFNELDDILAHADPVRQAMLNDVIGGPFSVPVRFAQFDREQYMAKKAFALDIPPGFGDSDVQIIINSLAGATAPTMQYWAMVQDLSEIPQSQWNIVRSNGQPVLQGGLYIPTLCKVLRKPRTVAGNSEEFNDLPLRDVLQGLYLYDPAVPGAGANTRISQVTVTIDGKIWFKRTKDRNDIELTRMGMFPVAGIFAVIPDITDDVDDSWVLGTKRSCEIHVDFDAAVTAGSQMKVLVERIGAPE